ncbi:MAG TPA: PKD domain-containing protein [Bacteroidales bacterium]|nr:PKD domain-containing protein [Bacteroidales bacterium]
MKSFFKSRLVFMLVITLLSISAKQARSQSIPIDFTFSGSCVGGLTYFYPDTIVMAVNGVQSVYWTFGDGDSSLLVNPVHGYANYGTYTVTLTVYADSGYTGSVTHYINISPEPSAFFSYSSPNCSSSPVLFTDLSSTTYGYINTWIWDFGDGSPVDTIVFPNDPNASHSFPTAGTFIVTLSVINSEGCSDTYTASVDILSAPIANFFYSPTLCEDQVVQFTDASFPNGAGDIVSWNWDFGDPASGINNTSNFTNPSHIYVSPGTYNVQQIVVNFNNCSDTTIKQVVIHALPSVDFSYTPALPCAFDLVFFAPIADTSSIATWYWQFGDGTASTFANPAHSYVVPGTYTVSLTVTDTSGCASSIAKSIIVNASPLANFSFPSVACSGTPVPFTDLSQTNGGGAIAQYYWNFGDPASGASNTSTIQNPQHVFANAGAYIVGLTITNINGCIDSLFSIITVNPSPAQPSAIAGNAAPCQGSSQTYSVTNVSGITYTWALPAGWTITAGQGTSSITVTTGAQSGNITVIPSNSCGNGTPASLAVSPGLIPAQTSAITGNATPCQGSIQSYSVTDVSGTTYIWTVPADWSITSGQGTSSITLTTGTQNGNITVTPSNNCGSGAATTLGVSTGYITAYAGPDIVVSYGFPVTIYGDAGNGSGDYSWSWQPANLFVNSTVQNPTTVNLTTTTVFTLTVTDNVTGCTDDDQTTVVVTGGELTVSAFANPELIYLGDSSQLNAPTSGGTGNYTWSWSSDPAGFTSGLQNPVVNPVESTMYIVTVNDGVSTATDSVLLTINYLPAPPAMPAGPDSVDLAYSLQTTFSIPAVANATLYEWEVYPEYAGVFAKSDVEGTISWSPSFMGYAVIKVRANNSYGYSEWSEEKIIFVDNTTGTGLHESGKLIIYPNPASASLHIEIPGNLSAGNGMMVIYDAKGGILSELHFTGNEMTVDVSAFLPGIYIVRFSNDKVAAIGKFVKD